MLRASWPFTFTESEPKDSVEMLGTTPGSRPMNPMKLRFTEGSERRSSLVMFPPTSFEVTSTMGASAVTTSSS